MHVQAVYASHVAWYALASLRSAWSGWGVHGMCLALLRLDIQTVTTCFVPLCQVTAASPVTTDTENEQAACIFDAYIPSLAGTQGPPVYQNQEFYNSTTPMMTCRIDSGAGCLCRSSLSRIVSIHCLHWHFF